MPRGSTLQGRMGFGRSLQHDDIAFMGPAHLYRYCVHADVCVDWIGFIGSVRGQWRHFLNMGLTWGSTDGRKWLRS